MRRLRLTRAQRPDARWLAETLTRVGAPFGSRVELDDDALVLRQDAPPEPAERTRRT
jgi:hypothetical protein